jgi:hypothetical protein
MLSLASVGRLLAQLGISCQKPLHRAVERDEALTKKWLRSEYPRIKALAQREHALIFFADAAHVRSDHHAGRTWGVGSWRERMATSQLWHWPPRWLGSSGHSCVMKAPMKRLLCEPENQLVAALARRSPMSACG